MAKLPCESCTSIDVRRWNRERQLTPGRDYLVSMSRGTEFAGNIEIRVEHNAVALFYRGLEQRVPLAWTPCHLGGERPWFVCSGVRGGSCGRRVAVLFDKGLFTCRSCCRLVYSSQQETPKFRRIRRARKIRARLGGGESLADPFPERPRGMHRSSYARICRAYEDVLGILQCDLETKLMRRRSCAVVG
jgi:hypothetical protein